MTVTNQPGRDLDALVAEHIFNWDRRTSDDGGTFRWVPPHRGLAIDVPHYSTDIRDAWTVVEKMKDFGFATQITTGIANGYDVVKMYNALGVIRVVDKEFGSTSVPHGICLAALRAKGVLK